MKTLFGLAAIAAVAFAPAHAVVLTQWTFNSVTPDANTGTGTLGPFIGTGTAALVGRAHVAASPTGSHGTGGTYRFDMVTISAAPIPESETSALMLAGLGAIGLMAHRRQA